MKQIINIFLITFCFFCYLNCFGDNLKIEIINEFNEVIKVQFLDSSDADSFSEIEIMSGKGKTIDTDFSGEFYLNLLILNAENKKISKFQVLHNYSPENKYKFIVPAAGALRDFKCSWEQNRITVNKIQGYEYYSWLSWLPWLPVYDGYVKITVKNNIQLPPNKNSVKFTLFALPVENEFVENRMNSDITNKLNIEKDKVDLKNWGIDEKLPLEPIIFKNEQLIVRWVDLLIHNYSAQSWILYGIEQRPDCNHIKFNYPELLKDGFTAFYPPQSQFRGPGFQFGVLKDENKIKVYPEKPEDRFFFVIGRQDNLADNSLEIIPLEILTGVAFGQCIENGVNIDGHDDCSYQVKFVPVNVTFSISGNVPENTLNKINMPIDENGKPAFKMSLMKDIKIIPELNKTGTRTGNSYIVSAKSKTSNKVFKYRLILIAPPFIAGNTPGNYSPDINISSESNIGNYLRYPLHLYLIPVNSENNDIVSETVHGKTALPDDLIGSIEYFISDDIH